MRECARHIIEFLGINSVVSGHGHVAKKEKAQMRKKIVPYSWHLFVGRSHFLLDGGVRAWGSRSTPFPKDGSAISFSPCQHAARRNARWRSFLFFYPTWRVRDDPGQCTRKGENLKGLASIVRGEKIRGSLCCLYLSRRGLQLYYRTTRKGEEGAHFSHYLFFPFHSMPSGVCRNYRTNVFAA